MLALLEHSPATRLNTNFAAVAQNRFLIAKSTNLSDVIKRHAKDQDITFEQATSEMEELLKFLTLCSINPGKYGMAGRIDHAWHCCILFTQKYASLCDMIGGKYIHHRPNTERSNYREAASTYADFIDDYIIAFGDPDSNYWPTKNAVTDCDDCTTCGHDCLTS